MELIVSINKKLPIYNLNKYQRTTLRHRRDNNKIIIMDADKNLGISIMKRSTYIKSILKEHLQKEDIYQNLNPSEANDIITKPIEKSVYKSKNIMKNSHWKTFPSSKEASNYNIENHFYMEHQNYTSKTKTDTYTRAHKYPK